MIKAVFFDWFNTVACYEPPREVLHSQLLKEFGIVISATDFLPALLSADKYFYAENSRSMVDKRPREEQAGIYFKYGSILLSEIGIKPDKDLVTRIIKRWPEIKSKMHFALFDDVLETLEALKKRKLVLGLITNATRAQISVCRELGLEPYLDFLATSEEAGADKPDSPIFLMALERAGTEANETVHVGDQYELDVAGARKVGIKPIMLDRYNVYPEITDCPRIRTLPELYQYL